MTTRPLYFMIILLMMFGILPQIGTDVYSPSIPAISDDFGVHVGFIQLSIAAYLLTLAFSQLIYGPWSEGVGRRIPLMVGLLIVVIGSLVCFYAQGPYALIFGRFIQGMGAGAAASLWRSAFRDLFEGPALSKYASFLGIGVAFAIAAAPVLGGYLHHLWGWRSVFVFLGLYALLNIGSIYFFFPETSKHHHPDRLHGSFVMRTYQELLSHRTFMGYTVCVLLSYGAFLAWFAVGSVILVRHVGVTPVYFGWATSIVSGLGMFCAFFFNSFFVERFGIKNMLRFAWSTAFLSGVFMLLGYEFFGVTVLSIFIPLAVFYFGISFVWPNAFAGAFQDAGKVAGYAGALYGFMQITGGALISAAVAHLPDVNQMPLGCIYLLMSASALLVFELFVRPPSR